MDRLWDEAGLGPAVRIRCAIIFGRQEMRCERNPRGFGHREKEACLMTIGALDFRIVGTDRFAMAARIRED